MAYRVNEMIERVKANEVLNVLTIVPKVCAPVIPIPHDFCGKGSA